MDSILTSVKKILGITADYTHFDADLIIYINTAFSILNQLGVGPENGFVITGTTETWNQFIGNDKLLELVKSYTALKVGMMFDPPTISSVAEAKNNVLKELEFRIIVVADRGD